MGHLPHEYTHFIAAIKAFPMVDEIESEQAIDDAIQPLDENLCGFDAVAVVPSHCKGGNSHAGIFQVAEGLADFAKHLWQCAKVETDRWEADKTLIPSTASLRRGR